ncbi:MAG TPA: cytochrome c oxidase subunit 3 [Gemmatimonadales bacterium]|nr:cytochrome c oxidase subunit 3 [Gemmatimonadales bacterium]
MSTTIAPPPPALPIARVATGSGGPGGSHVAETGVWIGIGTICMSFAALTSALVVRASGAPDWQHLRLPSLLYVNTVALLASSVTLELARRRLAAIALYATLLLGLLFVLGQVLAWRQLLLQQQSLASGPSSAFFYVFTVLHALHVLGGLCGLVYVQRRRGAGVLSAATYKAAALYWHFMAVLWLYLLLLLTIRG